MSQPNHPPTREQIEIVRWASSLGAVTAEALALRDGLTLASARARLAAARRRGLLARARPLAGQPALFTLTRHGLRECGARGIEPCKVSRSGAHHMIVCALAAAALERCYPNHRVTGEPELRRDEREHGRPLASARLGGTHAVGGSLHRPDIVLWPNGPGGGLPIPVEVELTIKHRRRLTEICRAWARCRTVAGVLYLAPADVQRALLRATAEAHAGDRVVVLGLDSLPGLEAVME